MSHPRRRIHRTSRIIAHLVLAASSALMLIPLLWLVSISLKQEADIAAFEVQWLPEVPQWGNFVEAVTRIEFLGYTRNSIVIATISALLLTLSSAFVGFGLARFSARGSQVVFAVIIATMMLPPVVTFIPTYILFSRMGMINTYWPWVLWGLAGSAYLIFLFRQTFRGLPTEIEDAAVLDGCSVIGIWWRIFIPLAKPTIAVSVLFSFVGAWGDYLAPKLLLSADTTTLAVALTMGYVDPKGQTINTVMAAGALLYTVPMIVVFALLQRFFIKGIATTGLK